QERTQAALKSPGTMRRAFARPLLLAALLCAGTLAAYGCARSIALKHQAQAAPARCSEDIPGHGADLVPLLLPPVPSSGIPLADGRKVTLAELRDQTLEPGC